MSNRDDRTDQPSGEPASKRPFTRGEERVGEIFATLLFFAFGVLAIWVVVVFGGDVLNTLGCIQSDPIP